ncbi:hypothetical protein DUZ99_18370 [Xylanibacillus composti]|uniref:Uncharacterized protein n=1 Tax=Xylanibacillus composti TaxID=1572762 RepID=A0A8J4M2P6_9BACL|nr:hypothetical protein [Xylanibacillus composti]MDT9726935.1 hypothetical protein [Xylanibacillus composti]GIQ70095.1 hypothetical protein XYCOK13_29190 [Xylanibacillus composti]
MTNKYVGVWGVFEEDYAEGLEKAFQRYKEAGIKHVMYGGIAHTFDVHEEFYRDTKIDPWIQINYEKNVGDAFGTKFNLITSEFNDLNALAGEYGLSLDFDITPGVSDPIVEAYPDTAVVDIEGKTSKHWMCPSNQDVRAYFYGRTEDILRNYKGIREVELDVVSIDFYDPQVVPDWVLPELYPLRQLAIGNCFCDHCVKKAKDAGLQVDKIKAEIAEIYKTATTLTYENFKDQAEAYRGAFDVMRFVIKHPELMQWLKFRGEAVDDFVIGMNKLVKSVDPSILISSDLVSPSFSWTLGQMYHTQPAITDLTKLMLYHKRIGSFEVKPLKRIQQAIPEIKESELLDQYFRLKAFDGPDSFQGFVDEGVSVENVYYEVKKAKMEVGQHHKIIAGLVGDPPATPDDVREAVVMAHKGGADGYMLHLWYGNAPKENVVAFGEQLRALGEIE